MIAVAPDTAKIGVSAAELSDAGSISSEGEPPIRRLYRKPCIKKRCFGAKTLHPTKIYGIDKVKNGVITTPPQPNSQPPNQREENVDLSSAVVNGGPSEVSAWNAFILADKLFSHCCDTITWVWNRCGDNIVVPENTASDEVKVQIEDGEIEF